MIFYITLIIGIFFDLYSKFWAKTNLHEHINVFYNLVYLKYVENTGIAFSIPLTGLFQKIITIAIIISIFYYYIKYESIKKNKLIDLSFGLILAGALANAYERIFNGVVTDFIGLQYFAIFNLADSFISIGVIIYLIVEMKRK
ncbi:MAG: signal peptidase II [Candidatus Gracilibacteria bacterium]|nr:signal peptidase II [Candidatus Gracilibacteria bacterium]